MGIPWIGEIPENWKIWRLKFISKIKLSNVDKKSVEGEEPVKLCNYTDVYYNDFITDDLLFMEATASKNQIKEFSLEEGDVLITKDSESPDDIAVSAFIPKNLNGVICGYHLAHIRANKTQLNGQYLFRSFQSKAFLAQFEMSANGITRFGIGKGVILNSIFLTPSTKEQTAIATYLDLKTALLDRIIEAKKRQIELLKEKRAALINRAVTKGLQTDVMFDTNAYDQFNQLSDPEKSNLLEQIRIVSTHIQEDELPQKLKSALSSTEMVETNGAAYNTSRYGSATYASEEDEKTINGIIGNAKRENLINDALIANTARSRKTLLVTDDNRLKKKCEQLQITVSDFKTFCNQFGLKDSRVEWIGKIPKEWEVRKLKFISKVQLSNVDKKSYDDEEEILLCNYVDVYKNDFITSDISFMKATASNHQIKNFSLQEGDVLITKDSETPDDIAVSAYVQNTLNGIICGYHLAHIRSDNKKCLGNIFFEHFKVGHF
ncbi:MAG: restriction endonuclease subunit S [Desulfamplus sp.]|nr:restriction endonuclease subunit S [Desulfamplus sp.]